MPYTMDNPPTTVKNLPKGAQRLFIDAFNAAYEESKDETQARRAGWANVKRKYKKEGDKWVRKAELEEGLAEISLTITKASILPDGTLRWQATASDTTPDNYGERTSLTLFQDWIQRAESGQGVDFLPPPHMPFLGISHYPSLDGTGEAGTTERMYIDGKQFKPGGTFLATPIGKALFQAVRSELELTRKGQVVENPIRISAAWWDLEHSHGSFVFTRRSLTDVCPMCAQGAGDKMYLRGQLDHFAATRVPVNPRTELALEEKSMAKKTRREDAASIVGEALADELEEQARLVGKSEALTEDAPEGLVIKADEEPDTQQMADGMSAEHEYRPLGGAMSMKDAEAHMMAREMKDKMYTHWDMFRMVMENILGAPDDVDKQATMSTAIQEFGDRVNDLKAHVEHAYLVALANVVSPAPAAQPANAVEAEKGDIVMPETTTTQEGAQIVAPANSPEAVLSTAIKAALENAQLTREAKSQAIQDALNSYVTTVKAQLDAVAPPAPGEQVAEAIKAALQPLAEQIGLLSAKLEARPVTPAAVPQQKSYVPGPATPTPAQPQNSLRAMVRRSVGIVE